MMFLTRRKILSFVIGLPICGSFFLASRVLENSKKPYIEHLGNYLTKIGFSINKLDRIDNQQVAEDKTGLDLLTKMDFKNSKIIEINGWILSEQEVIKALSYNLENK